jgi:hypothetical protein
MLKLNHIVHGSAMTGKTMRKPESPIESIRNEAKQTSALPRQRNINLANMLRTTWNQKQ